MKQQTNSKSSFLYSAIVAVLVIVIMYLLLSSYYNQKISNLEYNNTLLNKTYASNQASYSTLQNTYSSLQNSYKALQTNYTTLQNTPPKPYTKSILANKNIFLHTLTYPDYVQGFNATWLEFFEPTLTYVYYNPYDAVYNPLPNINSSSDSYGFNVTAATPGYLIINYTSDSSSGIGATASDCLANLYSEHTVALNEFSDSNSNGNFTIPIIQGKNCVYLSNPTNRSISVTFSATFVQYIT